MDWFVKTAAKFPTCLNGAEIAEEATKAVSKVRAKKHEKRLAFAGVGYNAAGEITFVLISNMHSDDGEALPEARDEFMCVIDNPPRLGEVRCVGIEMPNNAGNDLIERLLRSHRPGQKLPSMDRVQNMLAGAIEASAGDFVSDTALITILTKDGDAQFDVVTPGAKPGQTVDVASPYALFQGGTIMVMPSQRLRRAKRAR
jgi:hypothetical protein